MPKHWNPPSQHFPAGRWERMAAPTTLASLRKPAKYWVVSDAQLKRDLAGRTLRDVYRENRAGRGASDGKYEPRWFDGQMTHGGLFGSMRGDTIRERYMAECMARNHEPHPASLDPDHPRNCHRAKVPRADIAFVHSVPTPALDWPTQKVA